MKTVGAVAAVRRAVATWKASGRTVALVPTMGNLHAGHQSLVELAARRADRVVVSVFVNPTQFGPREDFAAYPRTLASDRTALRSTAASLLFAPTVKAMYPGGVGQATTVSVPGLSQILCGEFRPGHFDGVASVVARLFNIVQPDVAVFGQKDYQQLVLIRRMQADLQIPVRIVCAATHRERDGLAMSSRNQYLDAREREQAPGLYAALRACAGQLRAGDRNFRRLEKDGMAALRRAGFLPDYFAIREPAELALPAAKARKLVVLAAGRLGRARLIDNVIVSL